MNEYKIVQRKNRNIVYASGFYSLSRAEKWIEKYNPQMWMDKDITASDLEIVSEKDYYTKTQGVA